MEPLRDWSTLHCTKEEFVDLVINEFSGGEQEGLILHLEHVRRQPVFTRLERAQIVALLIHKTDELRLVFNVFLQPSPPQRKVTALSLLSFLFEQNDEPVKLFLRDKKVLKAVMGYFDTKEVNCRFIVVALHYAFRTTAYSKVLKSVVALEGIKNVCESFHDIASDGDLNSIEDGPVMNEILQYCTLLFSLLKEYSLSTKCPDTLREKIHLDFSFYLAPLISLWFPKIPVKKCFNSVLHNLGMCFYPRNVIDPKIIKKCAEIASCVDISSDTRSLAEKVVSGTIEFEQFGSNSQLFAEAMTERLDEYKEKFKEFSKCSSFDCVSMEAGSGKFQVCGRCKVAKYCSVKCQKVHWKTHKKTCKKKK